MDIFDKMAEVWPSAVVARAEMKTFTGGALTKKSMSNFDTLGIGPGQKIIIGRKVCYPKDVLVRWLRERALQKEIRYCKDKVHLVKR